MPRSRSRHRGFWSPTPPTQPRPARAGAALRTKGEPHDPPPRRRKPPRHLPDPLRHLRGGARHLLHAGPRTPRHRRRKRLGQIHDRPRHPAPDPPARNHHRRPHGNERRRPPDHPRKAHAPAARQGGVDDHAGPEILAEPGDDRRPADDRGAAHPRKGLEIRRPQTRAGNAGRSRHPQPRTRPQPLPARGLGRHGPAHHDRDDADAQARDPDRRRTHLGARRLGPAPGARHHGQAGPGPRHGADLHQPRPEPGGQVLRPHRHHVCRAHRRNPARVRPAQRAPSLHPRPAELGPRPRTPARAARSPGPRSRLARGPICECKNVSAISVRNLDVWFGSGSDSNNAVKDVTFAVEKGESFGLVGESGSGKSPILRVLAGLVDGWTGELDVAGERLGLKRSRAFHKKVQMVFQDPYSSLHPRQTVDRVLSEAMELQGIPDIDKRIGKLLSDVGLGSGFRFRYPHQLSGGQRQRVAIARAIAPEPEILLLDEPTSALDVSVQAEILNLLADLRAEHGLTYVMVSHDLGVVGHLCGRAAVMKDGEFVEVLDIDAMRRLDVTQPYTRHLLESSIRSIR
ncbi:MAG: hypothetical protein CML65_08580 [Rhodobacteraceae bacterium]|nr:hypothetical protein [Paracoccaceae bacterium]